MAYVLGIGSFAGLLLAAATSCAAPPVVVGGASGGGVALRDRAGAYEIEVLVDGTPAPTFNQRGETYVLGQLGARYTLRVSNHSGRRIEAVVSVDGRDVIDGKSADFRGKRGYLIPAYGNIEIDGWRISHAEAAAFRFSSVPESYAARTGSAREVGVIGVAVFPERYVPPPPPPPYQNRPYYPYRRPYYDMAPRSESEGSAGGSALDEARPSPSPSPPPPSASAEAEAPRGDAKGFGRDKAARSRSGLGTEYGEAVSSPIYEVEFVRANASRPSALMGMRYNDRDGLLAMGIEVDGPDWASYDREEQLRRTAEPFPAVHTRRFAAPPPGWRDGCCLR